MQQEREREKEIKRVREREKLGEEKERFEAANEMVKSRKTTFAVRCKYNGK